VTGVQRLLAKSYPGVAHGAEPPRRALLVEHSRDVALACRTLADVVGAAALDAAGLAANDLPRFTRILCACGWMQDIGKANSHFAAMVGGDFARAQLIRHEAVSMLLFTRTPLRQWLAPLGDGALAAIWGAVGHHRKFCAGTRPSICPDVTVFSTHPDLRTVLADMGRDLALGPPFSFTRNLTIGGATADISASKAFFELKDEFEEASAGYADPLARRFIALIKAFGIAADVAASAIPRTHSPSYSVSSLIREELSAGGLCVADVQTVIHDWAEKRGLPASTFDDTTPITDDRIRFQRRVGDSHAHLTLAAAGCGSGKSIAAYLWTRRWAQRYAEQGRDPLRLFFCLPTTGTTTEHYKDYALETGVRSTLAHSRAAIDLATIAETASQEDSDAGNGERRQADARAIEARKIEALALWSTPIAVATTDTVLGMMGNALRSLCAAPAILSGAVVFDEIHALDETMFGHLLVFLANFPKLPILLMTASLQPSRLEAIKRLRADLEVVPGPADLEELPRYLPRRIESREDAFAAIDETIAGGGKVLWVVNRVEDANQIYRTCAARFAKAFVQVYHSRFRYADRSHRHRDVIDAFKNAHASILVATQVAEMSLDLSADLLVTDLAPIPSLIQRMGRLNRRAVPAEPGSPKPALITPIANGAEPPYERKDLEISDRWLAALVSLGRGASQRDLVNLADPLQPASAFDMGRAESDAVFFSGLWRTEVRSIRDQSHTVSVILEEDWLRWTAENSGPPDSTWLRRHEVSIPLRDEATTWKRAGYLPIAPSVAVAYDWDNHSQRGTGAAWLRN